MRSKVLNLALGLGLGLIWSGELAMARPTTPPGDDLFPPPYQTSSTAAATSSPPPTPALVAPDSSGAAPRTRPATNPAPRPRLAPPMNARVGRARLESFPRATSTAAPAPRQTVATMLSTSSPGVPDYLPPESRGVFSRLFHRGEAEVPPGLPRGTPRREMIPPEPVAAFRRLGDPSDETVTTATLARARGVVDPLLAPRTAPVELTRPEPSRTELTARYAVDPLLAPRPLPPARDRTATLLSQIPPRSEDPLLARKPLVLNRSPSASGTTVTSASSPTLAGLDPFSPVIARSDPEGAELPRDGAIAPAAQPHEPPRLIARPGPPGGDEPLRRAGTTPDDL